ncbi:hypothetical protein [Vibrio rotiferianus]|uniref:hypothetical protein n=1 Tax=Vibrio rotiferianus TaxID=190895 RepID=UPI003909B6C9
MERGIFDFMQHDSVYKNSQKEWLVTLQQSQMYWYELLVNEHDEINTRKLIFSEVKELKKQVEASLKKRFVYFICSRIKVRFCAETPPVLTPYYGFMKLRVLIGRDEKIREFVVPVACDENYLAILPEIDETGRFITFCHPSGIKRCFSVHDYLMTIGVNLGYSTKVEYVGVTKKPQDRPLNGVHGGLGDVLYNVSNEDNDILIFFNTFKVITNAEQNKYNINYHIPNSMTDEVKVGKEGEVIEKSFRFYFDSRTQKRKRAKERKELINDLKNMVHENNIGLLNVLFEVEEDSEYYQFYSSRVNPRKSHCFTVKISENDLCLEDFEGTFDEFAMRYITEKGV